MTAVDVIIGIIKKIKQHYVKETFTSDIRSKYKVDVCNEILSYLKVYKDMVRPYDIETFDEERSSYQTGYDSGYNDAKKGIKKENSFIEKRFLNDYNKIKGWN